MDRLDGMRVFVAVVDSGGFSAASRTLKMPLATVSRKIAQLETHLGAQLLMRTTRKVTTTDSGQQYYVTARRLLDEIEELEQQASGEFQTPKGQLSLTAPTLFGRLHLSPIASRFSAHYSEVSIRMILSNEIVNYLEEDINIGIRIGQLTDNSMVAVQVGHVHSLICASPDYLRRHGCPATPQELLDHRCISYFRNSSPKGWSFKMPSGAVQHFPHGANSIFNSTEAIVDWVTWGHGISALFSYQAAEHLAKGELKIILSEYDVEPFPVSFVYPQGRLLPQKVRCFIDFALPLLRARLQEIDHQCSA